MKTPQIYYTLKQKADLKAAAQAGLVLAPMACKGLLKVTRGGALLPPPLRVAAIAVPVGIKLAVLGYGLHKTCKAATAEK